MEDPEISFVGREAKRQSLRDLMLVFCGLFAAPIALVVSVALHERGMGDAGIWVWCIGLALSLMLLPRRAVPMTTGDALALSNAFRL